jgi:hypothetical protein
MLSHKTMIFNKLRQNMKSINIRANDDGTFGGIIEVMVNTSQDLDLLVHKIKSTHKYIEVSRIDETVE